MAFGILRGTTRISSKYCIWDASPSIADFFKSVSRMPKRFTRTCLVKASVGVTLLLEPNKNVEEHADYTETYISLNTPQN